MKFSYRNYPILEKLEKGSLGNLPIFEEDKLYFKLNGIMFSEYWKSNTKYFIQNINVVSKSFCDATNKATNKLIDLWKDIVINNRSDLNIDGTFLLGNMAHLIHYQAKEGTEECDIAYYIFDKKGVPIAMYMQSNIGNYEFGWISSSYDVPKNNDDIRNWIYKPLGQAIILSLFKKYADVDTKTIFPNSNLKDKESKYINETKLKINYLDSKWFTNIVKSEGFSVRGHFRLQPKKKNGEWTKELIWINDFEKTGYTAKARKLINETE